MKLFFWYIKAAITWAILPVYHMNKFGFHGNIWHCVRYLEADRYFMAYVAFCMLLLAFAFIEEGRLERHHYYY